MSKLGICGFDGRGGVFGLVCWELVTGCTWTSFGGMWSPGRRRGSLTGVGIALVFFTTGWPLASNPTRGLSVSGVSMSSGSSEVVSTCMVLGSVVAGAVGVGFAV